MCVCGVELCGGQTPYFLMKVSIDDLLCPVSGACQF